MKAFLYGITLQWKISFRNRDIFVVYYAVPLLFYLVMGGVFTSIIPDANLTLISSMIVFVATMGGIIGTPVPLVEIFGSDIQASYRAENIPLWTAVVGNFISGFIHLFSVSIIVFLTAPVIYDAALPGDLPAFFLSLVLFLLSTLSVGTVFGLIVKNSSKLTMATQLVFMPSLMLSGIMFPVSFLPEIIQYLGRLFPATWGFKMMCEGITAVPVIVLAIIFFLGILIVGLRLKSAYSTENRAGTAAVKKMAS